LPSLAHANSHDSWAYVGMRTLNELLLRTRIGLYLEGSLPLVQEPLPPYVEAGVASVDALLAVSNIEPIDDAVLL
jgi:hypothetical protein